MNTGQLLTFMGVCMIVWLLLSIRDRLIAIVAALEFICQELRGKQ